MNQSPRVTEVACDAAIDRDDGLMAAVLRGWFTLRMADYMFHWRPPNGDGASTLHVQVLAQSYLHGAALALHRFAALGCDIATPLAHIDVTEADGGKHTLLVEEVVDWLNDPAQQAFVDRENLRELVR